MDRERESTQKVIRFINQVESLENLERINKAVNKRLAKMRPYRRRLQDKVILLVLFSIGYFYCAIVPVISFRNDVHPLVTIVYLVASFAALYFLVFRAIGKLIDRIAQDQLERKIEGYIRAREQTRTAREERRNQREQ